MEPRDRLRGGREPGVSAPQLVDQVEIKVAPEALGGDAPVVPVDRQRAAALLSLVHKWEHHVPRLIRREIEVGGVEEGRVHYMEGQLEQLARGDGFEGLQSTWAKSHDLVVDR